MEKAKNDWSSHIEAIKAQRVSTRAYAKRHDLALSTLYYWQRKLKSTPPVHTKAEPVAATKQSSKFVALRINESERVAPQGSTHCTWYCLAAYALKCRRCHPRSGSLIWGAAPRECADASGLPHRAGLPVPRTDRLQKSH